MSPRDTLPPTGADSDEIAELTSNEERGLLGDRGGHLRPMAKNPWKYQPFLGLDGNDDGQQVRAYLKALRETGTYGLAAEAINCYARDIATYRKANPEFQELCDEMLALSGDDVIKSARSRAVEGWQTPIIGGPDRDEVVAHEQRFSDRLTELFLKRHDPSFRDKSTVTVENGGVGLDAFDYSSYSKRVREKLRQVAKMVKEDEELRARGENPDVVFSMDRRPLDERLRLEQTEITGRYDRLASYLEDYGHTLSEVEQESIKTQLQAMKQYADICGQRADRAAEAKS